MSASVLRGLNWGHRRATAPMEASAVRFAETDGQARIAWEVQPLQGFESGLDATLADRYDLIIFDHPFCGAIVSQGLFRPLDAVLADLIDRDFIGLSLASYRHGERLWALPVDGATQVAVYRPDLIDGDPPATWAAVMALGRRARAEGRWLGLGILNPHGFLVLAALMANLGHPMSQDLPDTEPFHLPTLHTALDLVQALCELVHPDCRGFNAIDLHEAMSGRDDIVYAPVAYGYLTYAEADRRRPLRFADLPGPQAPHCAGSVLGGTGLAITRSCRDVAAAERFVRLLAGGPAQTSLIAAHHGQPARRESWHDPAADTAMGHAFSATRATMETAWVRPRFDGFIGIQHGCGAAVGAFLSGEMDRTDLIHTLHAVWHKHTG